MMGITTRSELPPSKDAPGIFVGVRMGILASFQLPHEMRTSEQLERSAELLIKLEIERGSIKREWMRTAQVKLVHETGCAFDVPWMISTTEVVCSCAVLVTLIEAYGSARHMERIINQRDRR
jgi:hypothetical protein